MKKGFALVFCLSLLFVLALPVNAAAPSMELIASTKTVKPGETFSVEAQLDNKNAVSYCTVKLEYDANQLELIGGTCDADVNFGQVVTDMNAGTCMLMVPRKLSGKMFTFEFRVKDNCTAGKVAINAKATVVKDEYMDVTGTSVEVSGSASVAPAEGKTEETASNQEQAATTPAQGAESEGSETAPSTNEIYEIITGGTVGPPDYTPKPTTEPQPQDHNNDDSGWGAPVGIGAAVAIGTFVVGKLLKKKKED